MLNGISKANILVANEPRKADPVWLVARLCAIGFFFIHGNLRLGFVVSRDSYDIQASSSGGTTVFRRPE